jgi:DNA primase
LGGRITREWVDRVRDASDIVRVVSDYVALKPSGTRFKGLCPFHQEKTPSFSVDPESKLFYCFGCQTGGDLFRFVQQYENVGFTEAVELLASRCGIPLPDDRPKSPEERARERALAINELAHGFFRRMLQEPAAASCRAYLERRVLGAQTIDALELGFAPPGWDRLLGFLAAKRVRPEEAVMAGLAVRRKDGDGAYDRFRDRLVFPIRSVHGRIVAFGARALEGDVEPKYLNSPETPAYVKGEHLYGLDKAREAIRREGHAIVVEGYMDVAALVQAGFRNTVASLGTAFTPSQAKLIKRFTPRVVVSYDGDAAGSAAAEKSIDLLLGHGLDVRIVDLPGGLDPDDAIRERGSDEYAKLVCAAPGYLDWVLRRELRSRDVDTPEDKVAVVNAVLPHIARLEQAIERVSWAGRLADAVRLDDRSVLEELRRTLRSGGTAIRSGGEAAIPRVAMAEAQLVMLLLKSEEDRRAVLDALEPEDLEAGSPIGGIVDTVRQLQKEGVPIEHATVFRALTDERHRSLLSSLAFRDESIDEALAVKGCLDGLKRRRLERERRGLQDAIKRTQDPGEIEQLLARKQELARRIAFLSGGMIENGAR